MSNASAKHELLKPLGEHEQLFFMHIPKTSGLSLIFLLDQRYVIDEICSVHEGYKHFLAYSPDQRVRFKFIRGHFPYKLVYELPQIPRTITFLRDPVKRTISAISQLRRNEEQRVSYFDEKIGDISIDQFLDHPAFGSTVPNVSVKYLNDIIGRRSQEKKSISLSLAKERLEAFDVIGLVERFNESLELLTHTLGFPPVSDFPQINVDPKHASRAEIKQNTLDRIADINRDEMELYEYGMKLFEERLARMKAEKARQQQNSPAITVESIISFDFRRVDIGRGWYVGERHQKHGIVRWSGPGTTSRITLSLNKNQNYLVRFRVLDAAARDILESLRLEVNGSLIPLTRRSAVRGDYIFEGQLGREILSHTGATEFAFKVNRTLKLSKIHGMRAKIRSRIQTLHRMLIGKSEAGDVGQGQVGLLFNYLELQPAK